MNIKSRSHLIIKIYLPLLVLLIPIIGFAQHVKEKPAYCEDLKMRLDTVSVKSQELLFKNTIQVYTIVVVNAGNRKNSNSKTANRMIKALKARMDNPNSGFRYVLIEGKQRKGLGLIRIYIADEIIELPFDETTFDCP